MAFLGAVFTAAAGSAFSAVLDPLVDRVYNCIGQRLQKKLKANLEAGLQNQPQEETDLGIQFEELGDLLGRLKGFLHDAEEKQSKNDDIRRWLAELEDAVYDTEDLLDDYNTDVDLKQLDKSTEKYKRRLRSIMPRLDKIVKERKHLELQFRGESAHLSIASSFQRPQTISVINDEHSIFGRTDIKNIIVEKLLGCHYGVESSDRNNRSFQVLPIVGMGGIRKTTLAKLVYNDEDVRKHFHVQIWVCVSNHFDVDRLRKEIIEAGMDFIHGTKAYDTCNLNALQMKFREGMEGKRYIIVLDDVWSEDRMLWECLLESLNIGIAGSMIMVTTRSSKVANAISCPMNLIELQGLPDDDNWKVFSKNAFQNCDVRAIINYPQFEMIVKEMSRKLKGSPLAAKTLGSLLNTHLDIGYWRKLSKTDLWHNLKDDIGPILQLSYQHLHPILKRCFAYCSLFPKDYQFEKDMLVDLWIVEGFVRAENGMEIQDVGARYFDDLQMRSFFQPHSYISTLFVMHDLTHDLAQSISSGSCSQILNIKSKIHPKNVRRISCCCDDLKDNMFKEICEYKKLSSLLLIDPKTYGVMIDDHLDDWFTRLNYLRVLILSWCGIKKLPDSVGNLKHLLYLDISGNRIYKVPSSIGKCHKLEVLNVLNNRIKELPNIISDLVHMKRLEADSSCISSLSGIGKLTSLLGLLEFKVENRDGHMIEELKDLNSLHGTLSINGLENVEKKEEATSVDPHKKEFLSEIKLHWSLSNNDDASECAKQEDVLEGLRPADCLKELVIDRNCGSRPPSWLCSDYMYCLERIALTGCSRWEALPPLGAIASLKSIELNGLRSLKRLDHRFYGHGMTCIFPSLENFFLCNNINLEEWENVVGSQCGCFPKLRDIRIESCPRLRKILCLPSKLEILRIRCCSELSSDHFIGTKNQGSVEYLSSLKEVSIDDSPKVIPSSLLLLGGVQSSLESLVISEFKGHDAGLTMSCLGSLVKLKDLNFTACPHIPSAVDVHVPCHPPVAKELSSEEARAPWPSLRRLTIKESRALLKCLIQHSAPIYEDTKNKQTQLPGMAVANLYVGGDGTDDRSHSEHHIWNCNNITFRTLIFFTLVCYVCSIFRNYAFVVARLQFLFFRHWFFYESS